MTANITGIQDMPLWWPDNLSIGIFFFLLGVTGAAIVVYFGGWDKLLGNSARIVELENEIDAIEKLIEKPENSAKEDWLQQKSNRKDKELTKEINDVRRLGLIVYLFVGGMVASMLADSMTEAIAFGAGWTGIVGMFGIKKDAEQRMEKDAIDTSKNIEEIKNIYSDYIKEIYDKTKEEINNKTADTYYNGYIDAVEAIAKLKNLDARQLAEELVQ